MKTQIFRTQVLESMAEQHFVEQSICESMARDYFGEIEWHRITGKAPEQTARLVFIRAYNGTPPIEFDVFDNEIQG
jgi:hypothetical protein